MSSSLEILQDVLCSNVVFTVVTKKNQLGVFCIGDILSHLCVNFLPCHLHSKFLKKKKPGCFDPGKFLFRTV
jgi:hypothetical protein